MKLPVCSCDTCKSMCIRPCLPTPHEAVKLIEAGYGNRLSYDTDYSTSRGDYFYLKPAKKGEEEYRRNSRWSSLEDYYAIKCTFQDEETGLCELHELGLKPIEARMAFHERSERCRNLHDKILGYWNCPTAQEIAENWIKTYCKNDDIEL